MKVSKEQGPSSRKIVVDYGGCHLTPEATLILERVMAGDQSVCLEKGTLMVGGEVELLSATVPKDTGYSLFPKVGLHRKKPTFAFQSQHLTLC